MPPSAEHRSPFNLDASLVVRDPLVVLPNATVADAIAQMHQAQTAGAGGGGPHAAHRRIRASCVLVVENGQWVGMLTEQDVVRLVSQWAREPATLSHTSVGQVMRAALGLRQSDWVDSTSTTALMQQHGASHLVILDNQDHPLGLVTCETLQPALDKELRVRRRIEARLADSERRYAALTALAPVCIFRTDAAGRYTYVNEHYCRLLQMTPAALVGQRWDYRLHPEDQDRVTEAWQQATQGQRPLLDECRLYRADDSVVWVYNRATAEYDDGQVVGYVGTMTDISEQKRREAEYKQAEIHLQQREARSRALLAAIPDHMVRVGADGVYREVVTPQHDFDIIPHDVDRIGRPMQSLLPEAVAEKKYRYMAQALRTGELQVYEQQVQNRDRLQHEEVRVIKSGDDEVLFMIRDISERKQAEAQLQSLIAGTATKTGQDFFPALARHISETLGVAYVIVAQQIGQQMHTLVRYINSRRLPNISYDVANTLCEQVLQSGSCSGESSVQHLFPEGGADRTAKSYMAMAFQNTSGKAIGTLCVFDAHPIKHSQRAEQILRVFAARAAAELERQRAIASLEQLNQQLETKIRERTTELQQQKQFLQTVLDTLPAPIFWIDRHSTYLGCNQPFARITGLDSPTDIIGKSITDVVKVRSEAEGFIANNQRVIETGRPELGIQESYTSLNGEQRLIETSKAPLMDLEGDVAGIVITFQDITERQRAAQELQYSEQRFRSATANAPFPIMIHSEDGEVIQISATWTELTGYTHEDMPTTAAWAQLAYGDRAGYVLENYIHKLYALASRWDEGEFTIATRDGTQRIWQFSSAPLGVLSDGRRAATSMAVDVTERRQAELALRESEERYRTIHNQAALGLISFSAEGNVIDANPSFCRMVGYSRAELLSKTALQLTHPDDHAEFFPAVTRLFASGEDSLFKEKRCLRKDGSYFWVGATVSVVRGASGQIKHALGMLQDISQRKQNEAERERAEAQVHALLRRTQLLNRIGLEIRASLELDTILHNLVQAIVAELPIDSCTFGRYTHGADDQELAQLEVIWEKKVPGSASCLGIYRADQYPLTLEKIANDQPFRIDSSTAAPDAALADCLEQVGLSTYFCLPIHTAGGGIGSFQLGRAAADHPWTDEEIELFHSIANQVAIAMYQAQLYEESQAKTQALERSYQELQGAQIHMVQAEKMSSLGQLVAGIAHEINNPVGFIYGNLAAAKSYVNSLIALVQGYQAAYPSPPPAIAHLLEQADVDYILADFPKLLASMENGATRIQTIVQSLRTFSRLEQVEQSAVDINRRIENTLVILQNRLNGRAGRPEIAVVRQYGDLPRIECYGSLLDQVFLNLLVNAIDAIEEQQACASPGYQGQITITTAIAPGHRASISFQDNGIGMDEKTQASIFDPFFTTKPIGVGTGMGLSISYQIVTGNHKGRLYCRSIVDAGTTFVVEIPQSLT